MQASSIYRTKSVEGQSPPTAERRGVWESHIEGRFRKITIHQLCMAWSLYAAGQISMRQLRVYFAAHEMAERRRYTKDDRKPLYGLEEIKALVGGRGSDSADAALSGDVRRLSKLGLVKITDHAIEFAVSIDQIAVEDTSWFWALMNAMPHKRRSVPVPRRTIRALAGGFGRAVTAVVLATMIRSLFWHKGEGYRVDGRLKASWISEHFGVSSRGITSARARLIELGWFEVIESPQWQLNQWGTHVQINVNWKPDESANDAGLFATPPSDNQAKSATPDLNNSSSLTGNINTRNPAPDRAGTFLVLGSREKKSGGSGRGDRNYRGRRLAIARGPVLTNMQPENLRSTADLLVLYEQARERNLARPGEGGRLDFIALAERSKAHGHDAPRLFYWLLREQKFEFITHADEDAASQRLRTHLYGADRRTDDLENPKSNKRNLPGAGDGDVELTEDQRLVRVCIVTAKQHRVDPFRIAQQMKGWTRPQWDTALAEYEQIEAQRWR